MTTINPGLRVVRRGQDGLQIGLGAEGILLEGLQEAEIAFLLELRNGIADEQLALRAAELGVEPQRCAEICAMLASQLFSDAALATHGFRAERMRPERTAQLGLYRTTAPMQRRERAVIHLVGLGRTGAALAAILAGSGIGTLLLEDDRPVSAMDVGPGMFRLSDIGVARSLALRRHLLRLDPNCSAHVVHDGGAGGPDVRCLDLAVTVGMDAVPAPSSARFLTAGRPHLSVLLREQDGTVGPLAIPGHTACTECVERHRNDIDGQWMDVCEQLTRRPGAANGPTPPGNPGNSGNSGTTGMEDSALATALAGTAGAHALLYVDAINQPSSWSSVLTFHRGSGRWTQQRFEPHPDCSCQWQNQSLATISSTAAP